MNMGITGEFSFTILTVRECRHTHGRFFYGDAMIDNRPVSEKFMRMPKEFQDLIWSFIIRHNNDIEKYHIKLNDAIMEETDFRSLKERLLKIEKGEL